MCIAYNQHASITFVTCSDKKIYVQINQDVLSISPFLCQYEEGKKRRKPNYSSVDLSEVEWEDRDDVVSDVFKNPVRRHCCIPLSGNRLSSH